MSRWVSSSNSGRSLSLSNFLLLGLGAGLITLHITLTSRLHQFGLLTNSILLWAGAGFVIWSKHTHLDLKGSTLSRICGGLLITTVLSLTALAPADRTLLHITPVLFALGWVLIASGFKGLVNYYPGLLILCFLIPDSEAVAEKIDIAAHTAQLSTTFLSILGYEAVRQGSNVSLPTATVVVTPTCAGFSSIFHLIGLGVLITQICNSSRLMKWLIPIAGALIGFVYNSVRVSMLAVLAAAHNSEGFQYWHIGQGSHLFSGISLLSLCALFLVLEHLENRRQQTRDRESC